MTYFIRRYTPNMPLELLRRLPVLKFKAKYPHEYQVREIAKGSHKTFKKRK